MAIAPANGVNLYYEEAGSGDLIVFVHEFGADYRSWEAQLRYFSREYRCIAYNARGYNPSDVPDDDGAYDYRHFADDIAAIIRHACVGQAHVVGLSMGAYAALQFGLRHKGLARSLVLAGCGSGAQPAHRQSFATHAEDMARSFLDQGAPAAAAALGQSATRIQLLLKDPRGWEAFVQHLGEHSAEGGGAHAAQLPGRAALALRL